MATESGCAETILIREGYVTEASASNVFLVRDGVILAPPKSHLMLPGITYDVVLELVRRQPLQHDVRELTETELRSAQEVWLTSSSREVLAVTTLDGVRVGNGKPGPVFEQVHSLYQRYKASTMRTRPNAST
jgi:D-alanine transaminase